MFRHVGWQASPICHDHGAIVKSLLERVIPRIRMMTLSQHGELLIKILVDERKEGNDRQE